jgi:uncharacterized protein
MQAEAPLAGTVTLGVRDFALMRSFYRRLGWPQVFDGDNFAAFELRGLVLALFPVDDLARDGRAAAETRRDGIRFSIIINVDHPQAVDALAAEMVAAGGRVTKPAMNAEFFDGRSAYVADPEGNYWEIAWAPRDNPVVAAVRRAAGLPA